MNSQRPIGGKNFGSTTWSSLALLLAFSSSAAVADLQQDIRSAWEHRQQQFTTGYIGIEYFDVYNAAQAPGQVNNGELGLKIDYVVVFDVDRMSIDQVGVVWLQIEGKSLF